MTRIAFAGPSVHGLESGAPTGIEMRGPAAAGDLLAAVHDGAEAIGLIDGAFEGAPAVWHKEILAALDRGVAVLGAASMGALRAAECHPFGMVGIGGIFAAYRDGRRWADADVAVQHAPRELGYRPLTVALVDAEATLTHALDRGRLSPGTAEALLGAARALPFRDRTWDRIAALAAVSDLARDLACADISQKRADAAELLDALASGPTGRTARWTRPDARFARTDLFVALERRVSLRRG